MKISVSQNDKSIINIPVANGLLFNPLIFSQLTKYANKELDLNLPNSSVNIFIKELKHFLKKHKNFVFIEVVSASGEKVIISF